MRNHVIYQMPVPMLRTAQSWYAVRGCTDEKKGFLPIEASAFVIAVPEAVSLMKAIRMDACVELVPRVRLKSMVLNVAVAPPPRDAWVSD